MSPVLHSRMDQDVYHDSMDLEAALDTHFRADMIQGRLKQRSLRSCGFISTLEQQLDQCSDAAMDVVHPGWPVLLAHIVAMPYDPCNRMVLYQLVCTLSCVSKGMRSTVLAQLAGQVSVTLCNRQQQEPQQTLSSFARWLPRQAAVMANLDTSRLLYDGMEVADWPAAEALLARAMWEAGSSLQLNILECTGGVVERAAALQALRTRLKVLAFTLPNDNITDAEAQPVVHALRQLTSLDSLTIYASYDDNERNVNKLLPGLSGLNRLTYLSAGFNRCADLSTYLPPSLVELYLGANPTSDPAADFDEDEDMAGILPPMSRATGRPLTLNLTHLTSVTWLDFLWEDEEGEWEPLYLGDQLPPNVRYLSVAVRHGAAVGVLWPLKQLTQLHLAHRHLSAEHLQSLSVLESLKIYNMTVHDPTDPGNLVERVETPEDYCEAWPLLRSAAWQRIEIDNGLVTPGVLDSVRQASHITRLQLLCHSDSTATHSDLAAALAPLKLLKELQMEWPDPTSPLQQLPLGSFDLALAISSCVKVVAGMTSLTTMTLRNLPLQRAAAKDIASLQQLTCLSLACCQLDDYAVNVIAVRLTGLKVLTLEGNKEVTDASMPTVATLMQQLKSLDLRHTAITADGRDWLQQGLPSLQYLSVCGRSIADSNGWQKAWPAVHVYCEARCPPHCARK